MLRFISRLFKSLWLFFPGILFLLFPIFCFWSLGQGKDIIIAFIDNNLSKSFFHFYYTRTVFFIVIGFWAYVSWYSSRIISYIKAQQQDKVVKSISEDPNKVAKISGQPGEPLYEISQPFLDEFPRIIGNACFLILELAVLQLPILTSPISSTAAIVIFIAALLLIRFINNWIDKTQSAKPSFRRMFWILMIILCGLIIAVSFIGEINIITLFFLLLLFHVVFIYYTNLRRVQMEKKRLL